ncbi:MAG: hypothetical protein NVS3B20_16770 [Polyangiales bacterium]
MGDPAHWLHRFSADQWLRAGMKELTVAREAMTRHATRVALASARRAAGMGWNAVLALETQPDEGFGRSYADHLRALAQGIALHAVDPSILPEEVREAARRLMSDPAAGPPGEVVQLLTPRRDATLIEAAETILAEAYARVSRRAPEGA